MSTTSKYKLVEQDLFAKIQSGELKVGQKIQTEAELCKHYGVSRMTVRKALDFLASQGIIRRIAGKGTFVSSLHIQTTQRVQGFSDGIASAGMTPSTQLVEYRIVHAEEVPRLMRVLGVGAEESFHLISRIRSANGIKVAISDTFIPCRTLQELDPTVLSGSLFKFFEKKYGYIPLCGNMNYSAVMPTQKQRRLLEIGDKTPLLEIAHPSYLQDGRLIEFSITYYVNERIVYTTMPPIGQTLSDN